MDIAFAKRKLEKTFNSQKALQREYGVDMARAIAKRMAVLRHARHLGMVPASRPERRHRLEGRRAGQFAVDLVQPFRLVFEPNHEPLPRDEDGGLDIERVTAIKIIEVVDYH